MTVPSPNAGEIFWDMEDAAEPSASELCSYINSIRTGDRETWIKGFYRPEALDTLINLSDEAIVEDILRRHRPYRLVYRCLKCGRLYIQEENGDWTRFKPEHDQE